MSKCARACVRGETNEERELKCERPSCRSRSASAHGSSCRDTECTRRATPCWEERARQLCVVPAFVSLLADKSEAAAFTPTHARKTHSSPRPRVSWRPPALSCLKCAGSCTRACVRACVSFVCMGRSRLQECADAACGTAGNRALKSQSG